MHPVIAVGLGWLGLNAAFVAWRWWATRNDPVRVDWREARGR